MNTEIKQRTVDLIDALKSTCQSYGLGNDGNEYKIITQVFLYKFLNDKFGYEIKKLRPEIAEAESWEIAYASMSEGDRLDLLDELSPDVSRLQPHHLISHLWNQQAKGDFDLIFDSTMVDIADENIAIFSTQTTEKTKIPLFEKLTNYVTDDAQRAPFARALVDKLVNFSFEEAFSEHYDFFAAIFEYLIKDYNTAGGGKYAEYYTPHAIATIMARLLVGDGANLHNVEIYDPSAGTGTLLMALSHQIGEDKCTIFAQDISQRSNKMLKLNLILNGLVSSLDHAVQGDTLVNPYHKSDDGHELRQFDYIVSNPPFNMDFSESKPRLDALPARFWAGVPAIPKKKKEGMSIYLLFLQHVINSLKEGGKAAVVVPSGFLTDTGKIAVAIREYLIKNKHLSAVVQMPTNVFATTNTSVSVVFFEKSNRTQPPVFVDASKLGASVKVGDKLRTVFSATDEEMIVKAVSKNQEIPEFATSVDFSLLETNAYLLKPGLYFQMDYPRLTQESTDLSDDIAEAKRRIRGIRNTLRLETAKNVAIEWFVDFTPFAEEKSIHTAYGDFPQNIELIALGDLLAETIGGDWGTEEPTEKSTQPIRCIRGTDMPNVLAASYGEIPLRYVRPKSANDKAAQVGDIFIEVSGGSPTQSTGRATLVTHELLEDFQIPVLCTNFCRLLRPRDPRLSELIYTYLYLLYRRGYFFNLENNTTGIKNLILSSFLNNVRVPVPRDLSILDAWNVEIERRLATFMPEMR